MNRTCYKLPLVIFAVMLAACGRKEPAAYEQTAFIMNVPAQVKVYGADGAAGKAVADAVLGEWRRISDEFSFSEPYSQTTLVNKKAYGDWVKVEPEMFYLLQLSMDYYKLTGGAFDITFAPLWPIWKDAASTRKMPAREDIQKALTNMGAGYVQLDPARRMVRFTKPVQINMGGIMRGYCFVRAARLLKELAPAYPVELRLGGNMLAYGARSWDYTIEDPFHDDRVFGKFSFPGGVVMSSSGRDKFVQIEGKLYSHILDLKTGYPIEDFSNLVVYFPDLGNENFIPSAVLAVMGQEKAFALLSKMKGTAAVWLDGAGKDTVFTAPESKASWAKTRRLF